MSSRLNPRSDPNYFQLGSEEWVKGQLYEKNKVIVDLENAVCQLSSEVRNLKGQVAGQGLELERRASKLRELDSLSIILNAAVRIQNSSVLLASDENGFWTVTDHTGVLLFKFRYFCGVDVAQEQDFIQIVLGEGINEDEKKFVDAILFQLKESMPAEHLVQQADEYHAQSYLPPDDDSMEMQQSQQPTFEQPAFGIWEEDIGIGNILEEPAGTGTEEKSNFEMQECLAEAVPQPSDPEMCVEREDSKWKLEVDPEEPSSSNQPDTEGNKPGPSTAMKDDKIENAGVVKPKSRGKKNVTFSSECKEEMTSTPGKLKRHKQSPGDKNVSAGASSKKVLPGKDNSHKKENREQPQPGCSRSLADPKAPTGSGRKRAEEAEGGPLKKVLSEKGNLEEKQENRRRQPQRAPRAEPNAPVENLNARVGPRCECVTLPNGVKLVICPKHWKQTYYMEDYKRRKVEDDENPILDFELPDI